MPGHYIEFENVRKSYGTGDAQINALYDASFCSVPPAQAKPHF